MSRPSFRGRAPRGAPRPTSLRVRSGQVKPASDDIAPPGQDYTADFKADPPRVGTGFVEPSVAWARAGARCQFDRLGYLCVDIDSAPGQPVLDRTVALRYTWAMFEMSVTEYASEPISRWDQTSADGPSGGTCPNKAALHRRKVGCENKAASRRRKPSGIVEHFFIVWRIRAVMD